MDSKILELGYGIKGVEITKIEEESGYIGIHIETKKSNLKCGECGSRNEIKRGYSIREFKDVPIGLRAVRLKAKVYRLECKNCLKLRQEKLSFAEKKKLYE